MKGNAFGILQHDWVHLSWDQWREFLRVHGAPSQKQCRDLAGELPLRAQVLSAEEQKRLLLRVMKDMSPLSVDEKTRWWKVIKVNAPAIHVGMDRGLDFKDVDCAVIKEVFFHNVRQQVGLAAKMWDRILPEHLRDDYVGKVLVAWADGDDGVFEKHWRQRLVTQMEGFDGHQRKSAARYVLGHAYEMFDMGCPVSPLERSLLTKLILMATPPQLLLLTENKHAWSDPQGLLPALFSEEEGRRLEMQTPHPARSGGSIRL